MILETCRDFKESISRMADNTLTDDPRYTNLPLIPYELPDGTMVDVGVERFQLSEVIIDPTPLETNHYLINDLYKNKFSHIFPGNLQFQK